MGSTNDSEEMYVYSLIQFARNFICTLYSSSAQCRGVRGECTELNVPINITSGVYVL